jgi:hypothetical protein
MSFMSLFEQSARNSVAISILNKMRHWLQGRQPEGLSGDEKKVVAEALEIIDSPQFEKIVIRSFQGLDSGLSSSVLPISVALQTVRNQLQSPDGITVSMNSIVSSNSPPESEVEKQKVIDFLNQAIEVISNSNLRVSAASNPLIKSYSKGL